MSQQSLTMGVNLMMAAWSQTVNTSSTTTPPTTTLTNMVIRSISRENFNIYLAWVSRLVICTHLQCFYLNQFQIAASSGSVALMAPAWTSVLSVRSRAFVRMAFWILTAGVLKSSIYELYWRIKILTISNDYLTNKCTHSFPLELINSCSRYVYPEGPVCDWPNNVNCTNDTPCDINLVNI